MIAIRFYSCFLMIVSRACIALSLAISRTNQTIAHTICFYARELFYCLNQYGHSLYYTIICFWRAKLRHI